LHLGQNLETQMLEGQSRALNVLIFN